MPVPSMLIAQITDFHITAPGGTACGGIDTTPPLAAVVADLLALPQRPDLVLMTGDLTDKGDAAACAVLDGLLAPLAGLPVRMIPGNHDDRDSLRAAFAARGWVPAAGPYLHHEAELGDLRLLLLDTLIPGRTEGTLDGPRLSWLTERLAEAPGRPTLLAMHHPPFPTGLPDMDRLGCSGAEELARLIVAHGAVAGVVCGHVHRAVFGRWVGTAALVAPSAARQFAPDFAGAGRPVWSAEPPAYLLHRWTADGGLVSHLRTVGPGG